MDALRSVDEIVPGLYLCAEQQASGAPRRLGLSLLVRCNALPDRASGSFAARFERYDWGAEFGEPPVEYRGAAEFLGELASTVVRGCPKPGDCGLSCTFVLQLPADDCAAFPLDRHFDVASRAIDVVVRSGARALVHCAFGVSRSAAIVAAYLLRYRADAIAAEAALGAAGVDAVGAAVDFLRRRRPVVDPNTGFVQQLQVWSRDGSAPQ